MNILPAIDLKEGKAVRLLKGQMSSAKIYSHAPWELAKQFEDLGAKWLHIVDLDGAFAGEARNFSVIEKIISRTSLKVEIGGGIRSREVAKHYLNAGANRVILGSVALTNPEFVKQMAEEFCVAVGIDALGGKVATQGWAEVSEVEASHLAKEFANCGVAAIIATDISQDGTLSGLNLKFTEEIAAAATGVEVIASGGVASLDDIIAVKNSRKIAGVIVGKAFYEGKIDLKEAFKIALS